MDIQQRLAYYLTLLPDDPYKIEEFLYHYGYGGRMNSLTSCPLANYLKATDALKNVVVNGTTARLGSFGETVALPTAAIRFVYLFDSGRFPRLTPTLKLERQYAASQS